MHQTVGIWGRTI